MKQFADLQTGVRVYLDESSQGDFLDSEVQRSINYAYHDVITRVMEVYEQFYETTTPFQYALVAKQQEYTIDPSLIKVTRVEINYNPNLANSQPNRAVPVKMDEALLNIGNIASQGNIYNAGYYLHGNIGAQTIGLVPPPSVSDTTGKSISVWGIAIPGDLVNPTDNVNIPYADNFSQLVELKAASILLEKGQQSSNASTKYMDQYDKGTMRMQQFLKERQADGVAMITDAEVIDMDFSGDAPF